jgi:N-acetylglucosaminyldiphosphoundecaprenol N-acetyl-beta-D-mannosaminyltransferase
LFGTTISPVTYRGVCEAIVDRPSDRALTVACCNVHSIMEARRDPELARALADADIATPDGMPLVWALNSLYEAGLQERVYGPDLMLEVLRFGLDRALCHYFFGATEETLHRLVKELEVRFEGIRIAGFEAPPFRPLDDDEVAAAARRMTDAGADIVWLGLGMPKQELLMPRLRPHLAGVALVGVGAAFDFVAGNVPQAPRWMQERGLEWAFRLAAEPRRLWRRYLLNNPVYLGLYGMAWAKRQSSRLAASQRSSSP